MDSPISGRDQGVHDFPVGAGGQEHRPRHDDDAGVEKERAEAAPRDGLLPGRRVHRRRRGRRGKQKGVRDGDPLTGLSFLA